MMGRDRFLVVDCTIPTHGVGTARGIVQPLAKLVVLTSAVLVYFRVV